MIQYFNQMEQQIGVLLLKLYSLGTFFNLKDGNQACNTVIGAQF